MQIYASQLLIVLYFQQLAQEAASTDTSGGKAVGGTSSAGKSSSGNPDAWWDRQWKTSDEALVLNGGGSRETMNGGSRDPNLGGATGSSFDRLQPSSSHQVGGGSFDSFGVSTGRDGSVVGQDVAWGSGYGPDDEDAVFASGNGPLSPSSIPSSVYPRPQRPPANQWPQSTFNAQSPVFDLENPYGAPSRPRDPDPWDSVEGSGAGVYPGVVPARGTNAGSVNGAATNWWATHDTNDPETNQWDTVHEVHNWAPLPTTTETNFAWYPQLTTTTAFTPVIYAQPPPETPVVPDFTVNEVDSPTGVQPVDTAAGQTPTHSIYESGVSAASLDPFKQPGILAAIIGGAVVGLLAAITLVMFIVYRMRKKDEGSYALDEPKGAPPAYPYAYQQAPTKEFYA